VASVVRAGIQPSQYSTARRQAAGVPPPYQIGIGRSGVGLSATSEKSKYSFLNVTRSPVHSRRQISTLLRTSSARSAMPVGYPAAANS
jgi:hypothetical protein